MKHIYFTEVLTQQHSVHFTPQRCEMWELVSLLKRNFIINVVTGRTGCKLQVIFFLLFTTTAIFISKPNEPKRR